jgi:hypothetical protein
MFVSVLQTTRNILSFHLQILSQFVKPPDVSPSTMTIIPTIHTNLEPPVCACKRNIKAISLQILPSSLRRPSPVISPPPETSSPRPTHILARFAQDHFLFIFPSFQQQNNFPTLRKKVGEGLKVQVW